MDVTSIFFRFQLTYLLICSGVTDNVVRGVHAGVQPQVPHHVCLQTGEQAVQGSRFKPLNELTYGPAKLLCTDGQNCKGRLYVCFHYDYLPRSFFNEMACENIHSLSVSLFELSSEQGQSYLKIFSFLLAYIYRMGKDAMNF